MHRQNSVIRGIQDLCEEFRRYNQIDAKLYEKFDVKRGLRNQDGTGVMAGLTQICNVHGYVVNEGEREPVEGALYYRGYDVKELVGHCVEARCFGFEEVVYLLIFGVLPTEEQLAGLKRILSHFCYLPEGFLHLWKKTQKK